MTRGPLLLSLWLGLASVADAPAWALPTREAGPGVAANAPVLVLRWRTFALPGGRFSVLLPGPPMTKTFAFADGNIGHTFIIAGGENRYLVRYSEEAADAVRLLGPEKILLIEQDAFLSSHAGTAPRWRHLSLGTYPCQEIVISLPRHRQETSRACLVANRMYHLVVVSLLSDPEAQADADRFLNSFTPTPAASPNAAR